MSLPYAPWTAAIRAQLIAAGIAGGNVEQERDRPTKGPDLPICVIFVVRDGWQPDGDPGTATPKYVHATDVVVFLQDAAANGPALRTKLYAAADAIAEALLPTQHVWGGEWLQGVAACEVAFNTPPEGERVMGAVEFKLRLVHRTIWPASEAGLPDFATVSVGVDLGEDVAQPGVVITIPTD